MSSESRQWKKTQIWSRGPRYFAVLSGGTAAAAGRPISSTLHQIAKLTDRHVQRHILRHHGPKFWRAALKSVRDFAIYGLPIDDPPEHLAQWGAVGWLWGRLRLAFGHHWPHVALVGMKVRTQPIVFLRPSAPCGGHGRLICRRRRRRFLRRQLNAFGRDHGRCWWLGRCGQGQRLWLRLISARR
jgi:hypothetical protein